MVSGVKNLQITGITAVIINPPSARQCRSAKQTRHGTGERCLKKGKRALANREKGARLRDSAARPHQLGRTAEYLSAGGLIYASGR